MAASIKANTGRYDKTRINGARMPPYHRLDIRAEWTFRIGRASLVAYVEVNNVYNRDNVFLYKWSRTTKSARAVYQWGRLPVAGLRVEF